MFLSVVAAVTPQHGLEVYLHRGLLTVLKAGKPKSKVVADPCPTGEAVSGSQTAVFWLCPHREEGAPELAGVFIVKAPVPFVRVPPS